MKLSLICAALLGVLFFQPCLAHQNVTQVGRYLTIANKPKLSQTDLLSQIIQVRFPQKVQTIGEAMVYILRFSGYDLGFEEKNSKVFKITLSKQLPIVDRELGPISLKDGLTILAGSAFYLVENPVNRTVYFRLKPQFKKYG
jgi:conjugative transfer region protein (TIGR03748 family)